MEVTILLLACEEGAPKIAHLLLEAGVDPNSQNEKSTCLRLASIYNHYNIVDDLLKHKADPDLQDGHERTALHYACEDGYSDIVDRLLKAHANPYSTDEEGDYSIQLAVQNGDRSIVRTLPSFNVNVKTLDGETLLYLASRNNHEKIVDLLVKEGADPNIATNYEAVDNENAVILESLLKAGANPNVRTNYGEYPLGLAVKKDNPRMVRDLLQAGANPFVTDYDERTPRDLAIRYSRIDLDDMLKKAEEEWEDISFSKEPV